MSIFGPYHCQITRQNGGNQVTGQLWLTHTPNNSGGLDGQFTYLPPVGQPVQPAHDVTFGPPNNGTYEGSPNNAPMRNAIVIPGVGSFQYATLSFNPDAKTLTGTFSQDPPTVADTSVTWQADPTVPVPDKGKPPYQTARGGH